ncbi:MAG: Hint domain-containing protein, partial [Acidiphilium sp.]
PDDLFLGEPCSLHRPAPLVRPDSNLSWRKSAGAGQNPETVWPVRIAKGAIAEGLPERPLYLSPDHALYLDGHLIPAKALVNGRSIVQERRRHITYYHIELETHDVLLAESLPVESYHETGNRNFFENGGGVIVLHPNIAQALREAKGCAPFAERGPVVTAVRDRINRRLPALPRTTENAMRAVAAGLVLPITVVDATTYRIDLPTDLGQDILLLSHEMIPADIDPASEDRRRLGLDIARLTIETENTEQQIMLDSPLLREGWHVDETNHRWTNGAAVIPATLFNGAAALTVHLSAPTAYPVLADRDTALNAG